MCSLLTTQSPQTWAFNTQSFCPFALSLRLSVWFIVPPGDKLPVLWMSLPHQEESTSDQFLSICSMSSSPPSWYTSLLMLHSPTHRGSLSFPLVIPGVTSPQSVELQSASSVVASEDSFLVRSSPSGRGWTSSKLCSFADESSVSKWVVHLRVARAWLDSQMSSPVIPGQLRLWKFRSFCEDSRSVLYFIFFLLFLEKKKKLQNSCR